MSERQEKKYRRKLAEIQQGAEARERDLLPQLQRFLNGLPFTQRWDLAVRLLRRRF